MIYMTVEAGSNFFQHPFSLYLCAEKSQAEDRKKLIDTYNAAHGLHYKSYITEINKRFPKTLEFAREMIPFLTSKDFTNENLCAYVHLIDKEGFIEQTLKILPSWSLDYQDYKNPFWAQVRKRKEEAQTAQKNT